MGLRKFSSGLKRKLKHRFWGGRHELEGTGGDVGGGDVGSTISLPQPGPHAIAKGEYDRPKSWDGARPDGGRVDSADPTPHSDDPGFVPASKTQHDRGGGDATFKGMESSERGSHLRLDVERAVEGAPNQGGDVDRENVDQLNPFPSACGVSESMQTTHRFTHCL